ncbi:MAG: polysaccharide biosynthesis tyrosine autokinase [Tildeniella nuda ZEHNDER 1965/U140]|jgi:capsular exopolysaccharide synthesis family protein|nr:polysaccharide biosynthesis tyrosine autokinase [Tildeniella nuda ZEHNDER 1965/U140]
MNSDTRSNQPLSSFAEPSRNGKLPPSEFVLEKGEDEDFDVKQILTILKRRSSILVPVFASVTALLSLLVLLQPPSYSGKFSVLVEPVTQGQRLTNSLTSSAEAQRSNEAASSGSPYDPQYVSQIAVLKSQNLLEAIAKEIQVRYPDVTAESLIRSLKINNPKDTKVLDITYGSKDPAQVQFVLQKVAEGFIKYSIEDRQRNLRKGIDYADDQLQRQNQKVEALEAQLEAFRRTNSLVDPKEESQALTSQLSALLSEQRTNQVKYVATRSLYANLLQQLRLDPSEGVIAANLSESPGYLDLLGKLRDTETRLAKESARLRSNTPVVQALQDERDRLLPLLQAEAQRILGKSRTADQTNGQDLGFQGTVGRDLIKNLIDSANQVQVLQAQQLAIARALSALNGEIRDLATSSRSYGQISRNLAIATDSLNRLQAARENLQLEYARQRNVWELLSKVDEKSVNDVSGTSRKVFLGVVAGLLLGVAAAFLAEKLDRIIHSPDDLKATHLPVLGMIPYQERLKQLPIVTTQTAFASVPESSGLFSYPAESYQSNPVPFLEAFYSLDANLRLLNSDAPIRSVVVSSSTPSEGKSTVAIHLAVAAATMGRKVLLVDADMRLPQVDKRLQLPNFRGLSDLLTSDADPMELSQPFSENLELYVLTSGQSPPAPGRLLSSKKMAKTVEFFTTRFDLVIFDSPPLLGFVDAKLLAAHTNGILLVAGLGKTKRDELKQSLNDLNATAQTTLLGIVANGLKPSAIHLSNDHRYQKYNQNFHDDHTSLSN